MEKLINTFRYGDMKTRLYLILVLVLMLGGIALAATGVSQTSLVLIGIGGAMLITDVVLVFRLTGTTVDGERTQNSVGSEETKEPKNVEKSEKPEKSVKTKIDVKPEESEEPKKSEKPKKVKKKKAGKKGPKAKKVKTKKLRITSEDEAMFDKKLVSKVRTETIRTPDGKKVKKEVTDYTQFDNSSYKQLVKRYKVPKKHLRIIIDSCKSLAIDHAPALCYVKRGRMHFILLEGKPRCETIPFTATFDVTYRKGVKEDNIKLYNSMRDMEIYSDFEDCMPTFSIEGGPLGDNQYFKNLYCIGKDLLVPPRSMKVLMANFKFNYRIFESLSIKGQHSVYFKKAYEQRILWSDGVLTQNEYQSNIREILQSMVDDESLIRYDFIDDLEKMVRHRLITDEYATFYRTKRD